jgi:hypothetical protein
MARQDCGSIWLTGQLCMSKRPDRHIVITMRVTAVVITLIALGYILLRNL